MQINPDALKEADKIDELIANTKDKSKLDKLPLLGIPFTAKDSVCIRGLAVTVGLVSRKNEKADKDSDVGEWVSSSRPSFWLSIIENFNLKFNSTKLTNLDELKSSQKI